MIRVLFVCLGNICRSPMAEAVFQNLVQQAGLSDSITVDSAGTGGWHVGERAHSGTRNVLKRHNIPYDGRARQFTTHDGDDFTYILAMDTSNLHNIHRTLKADTPAEVMLFLQVAYDAGLVNVLEVPDPYYDNRFDEVYELVNIGAQSLLQHIREQHAI